MQALSLLCSRRRYEMEDVTSGEETRTEAEAEAEAEAERVYPHLIRHANVVYVCLNDRMEENKANLMWCLQSFRGSDIVILHVHRPPHLVPGPMGGKAHFSTADPQEVHPYRSRKKEEKQRCMSLYVQACKVAQAVVEYEILEWDDVATGIVESIFRFNIQRLVMGAAANSKCKRNITSPTSSKAIHVRSHAPPWCNIWFLCNGNFICKREAPSVIENKASSLSPSPMSVGSRTSELTPERSQSSKPHSNTLSNWFRRKGSKSMPSPSGINSCSQSSSSLDSSISYGSSVFSVNLGPGPSSDTLSVSRGDQEAGVEAEENGPPLLAKHGADVGADAPKEEEVEELWECLQRYKLEAKSLKREALEELEKRQNAEECAIDAVRKARQADRLRKEAEEQAEKMAKQMMEMESKITELRNENASLRTRTAGLEQEVEIRSQELKEAIDERQKTEIQIAVLDHDLKIESEKLQEAVEKLAKLRREELQTESFIEFTLDELRNATHGFDENLVIGAGGFGTVYRGQVHYTAVAIKKLNPGSTEGAKQFKQEILALTKLRHPHLVTLIGACPEEHCLVYELLINGSLEDRLFSNHKEQIFWWKDRLRVAAEVCLGLLFLHSNSMVHGDVKPANILLDANNKAKIADFGICRFLPKPQRESTSTVCKYTDPRGTKVYMDPEFMSSGKLTYKSDVYAFGIILMQLLTKKPGFGLPSDVGKALNNNALHKILDDDAGNWPIGETSRLANLALQCCELRQKCRPDLENDVWKILQRYL